MGITRRARHGSVLLAALAALAPGLAHALPAPGAGGDAVMLAYVDPGAGSLIIQAIVATIAGAMVAGRLYWRKIRGFFGAGGGEVEEDEGPSEPSGGV